MIVLQGKMILHGTQILILCTISLRIKSSEILPPRYLRKINFRILVRIDVESHRPTTIGFFR